MSSVAPSPAEIKEHKDVRKPRTRRIVRAGVLAIAIICTAIFFFRRYWPFERQPVLENLQEASDSRVQIRGFHQTFFPSPGCVLDGVVFTRGAAREPLITIYKLTIRGTYWGIFNRHVSSMNAEGMRVSIPVFGTAPPFHAKRSTIAIDEMTASGMTVEFARKTDTSPLRFDIHEVLLRNVGWDGPMTYRVEVHNPEPPGEVHATGKFGVWNDNDPAQTPISGEYKFEHADLSVYHGIGGTLSSEGKFDGKLGHIDIAGTTDTPDFEVESGRHPVRLTTEFSAYVDAVHGDTFLQRVDALFGRTRVTAQGSIARSAKGKGKTALLELVSNSGRIEDILRLFVESDRAPMSGLVSLHAKVEIPSGGGPFLEKAILRGGFGVTGGDFSSPSTQDGVNKLSAGASGKKNNSDPETVLTDLTGQASLVDGVATLRDLSFGVPGATAILYGTYNVMNHKIDLRGQMRVDSKISKTTSGTKAFLLKMMDPFFKKRNKGEVVPVRISGTYEKPSFGLDLNDKQAQSAVPPSDASRPQKR